MKLLLVGEDRAGALSRSLEPGLRTSGEVTVIDPASQVTALVHQRSAVIRLRRHLQTRHTAARFLEAVEQLRPDVTLLVKGRDIDPVTIERARSSTRVLIYYPDNPFWGCSDRDSIGRLAAADIAVVWSHRLRARLEPFCRRTEVVHFGYDRRWFPLSSPESSRNGVVFVGTWNPRRERYLRALHGLPLTVVGSGWERAKDIHAAPPTYGADAGSVLRQAAVGVNVFHFHNAGAHNMRTREIAAAGAVQLTDPGTDGTPLRDGEGCRWFRSPAHLRELAVRYLDHPEDSVELARRAQQLLGGDTYDERARELVGLVETLP